MSTRVLHVAFSVNEALRNRFYSKTIAAENGCRIWVGAVQRNGYGAFKIDGRKIDSHVASWRISNGGVAVPIGSLVMHNCNCRLCVNPEHLLLGTPSQNAVSANVDGRGDDFRVRGEESHNAVLSVELVVRIRSMSSVERLSGRAIARQLGLSYYVVRAVLERRSWSHL